MYNSRFSFIKLPAFVFGCLMLFASCQPKNSSEFNTWSIYRGDEGSNAYSQLDQINLENVAQLKVAWTYRSGDKSDYNNLECNPIIINNILYGISPRLKTFALDAVTGKQLWILTRLKKTAKMQALAVDLPIGKAGMNKEFLCSRVTN